MNKRTKWILGIILFALTTITLISVWYYTRNAQYWYDKGMALYDSGISKDLGNPNNIVQAYNKFNKAVEAFDKALKINPAYKEAWLMKAQILYCREQYQESLLAYE
jgi:tetratricopeptide (TPR) repeat protein